MGYQLIEHIEVGSGGVASIEFTGIPQDGVDLVLKLSSRFSAAQYRPLVYLNNETGMVYSRIGLLGNGSTVSNTSSSYTGWLVGSVSTDTANTFGNSQLYISNYSSLGMKTISTEGVQENNATDAEQALFAISRDSGPVTQINLTPTSGNFVQYSTASLYKITAD